MSDAAESTDISCSCDLPPNSTHILSLPALMLFSSAFSSAFSYDYYT
jgi:hypothetical protein